MTLYDQIIDEAEELARNQVMHPDASNEQIVDCVAEIVNINLFPDSIGAHLALASYWRIANAELTLKSVEAISDREDGA